MKFDLESWKVNNFENELQFQCKAIELISYFFPKLRGLVFHPKNEVVIERKQEEIILPTDSEATKKRKNELFDNRSMRMRNRWIAEGMLPGATDIIIFYNGIRYCIELKLPSGVVSPQQKIVHARWNEDCELIPIQLVYTLYHVYIYCRWIISSDLEILREPNFEPFKLIL